MDTFIEQYFASGLHYDIDIHDKHANIIIPGYIIIKIIYNTDNFEWSTSVQFGADIPFEIRLDIARYITRVFIITDIEHKYMLNGDMGPLTISNIIEFIQIIENRDLLITKLMAIFGESVYIPVKCDENCIITWMSGNRDSFSFILNTILNNCFVNGVTTSVTARLNITYKPRPEFIKILTPELYKQITDGLIKITELLASGPENYTEHSIYETSWIAYEVIRCAIANFGIYRLELLDVEQLFGDKTITLYNVKYNDPLVYEKYDKLLDRKEHMAYHGSSLANWYGILFNGLFVAKDNLVQNGTAHGTGIYTSDKCNFSLTYCNPGTTGYCIMGVFQTEEPLSKYKKSDSIFVINDESKLCLRYIMVFKSLKNTSTIDNYFIKGKLADSVKAERTIINVSWSKRIMGEIKDLLKRDGVMGDDGLRYTVNIPSEKDMTIIQLNMCRTSFSDSKLGTDMDTLGVKFIKFEIRIPSAYPFEPPFIRIVNPRFIFRTGHITVGGSICMELLTKQRWLPTLCVSGVFLTIIQNMIAGEARLDPHGTKYEYSMSEAGDSFKRMLVTHSAEWGIN